MFETSRPFNCNGDEKVDGQAIHFLSFEVNTNQIINVQVEIMDDFPFAVVKFYDEEFKNAEDPFGIVTGKGNGQIIFRTCLEIMIWFYKQDPRLSFGFAGAPTFDEIEKPDGKETQRSRIYQGIATRFFAPINFQHLPISGHSTYVLLNRAYCDPDPALAPMMYKSLQKAYPEASCWHALLG